jgi:peptidyl-prolyl isomerase E (cyclophilin E)
MSKRKNILYVGGIDQAVTEEVLYAAFIPFGDLKTIQIPKDFAENKNRGFAFVEFESEEDASDALDNMDGAEVYGKVLRCNVAKQLPKVEKGKAVWSADEWISSSLKAGEGGDIDEDDTIEPDSLIPENQ